MTEDITKRTINWVMEKMQVQTLPELISLAERVGVLGAVSTTDRHFGHISLAGSHYRAAIIP